MDAILALLPAIRFAAGDPPNLDWLGPVVTAIGGVLVAAVGGISLVWRRRQDRRESVEDKELDRAPKEVDAYEEMRLARAEASRYYRLFRTFEDLFYSAHAALRFLARRVHDAHPEQELDKNVVEALALRPPEDLNKV